MLRDLMGAALKVGLSVHPGKTKVLANEFANGPCQPAEISVCGSSFQILTPIESCKYLGKQLNIFSFPQLHDTDIDSRIRSAWRKFSVFKKELTSRCFRLKDRLRLFNSVITPCLLYGGGCWTLTAERRHKLATTQRKMVRKIVGTRRWTWEDSDASSVASSDKSSQHQVENWVDYIKRATRVAEDLCSKCGVEDSVSLLFRAKFRLAGHILRRSDSRWSAMVLSWTPEGGCRARGRPHRRWTDDLDDFFKHYHDLQPDDWRELATNREVWKQLESVFVESMIGH